MIQAGIIGATGFAGAELVRLLYGHPAAELCAISSVSFAGESLSSVYPAYAGLCDAVCESEDAVVERSEVVFAALPHGLSQAIAEKVIAAGKVFIDLGADFRLQDEETYAKWYGGRYTNKALHAMAVYGLPELFREKIRQTRLIANPGCYTTAVPLALAPVAKEGWIEMTGIIADCKSGVTGAGRSLSEGTHYPLMNEAMHPYKVAHHRHGPEIEQTLLALAKKEAAVTFVPHLIPANRGILATCYARLTKETSVETLHALYTAFYENEPFVRVKPQGEVADIHHVRYSNLCDISIHVDPANRTLIAVSALDNMGKGAAGQAIQNMNLVFGLEETAGLAILPPAF